MGSHPVADGSRTLDDPQDRDATALTAVYHAHARYVWRVLRHCGVPDSDLDDAVQETFLVVFRRLSGFEARASLRTWIYAVAVRVAATRRRSQRREDDRRERAGAQMHAADTADPEAALSRREAAELVDRLLDELDAPKRTVFVLAELEGVRVPEISRILGVNPRTVHSRLRLARERFGSALRRMQAHEQGNRRVAQLRPRPLLEQAANDQPPASRRKAALAALAVRIGDGTAPVLPGWEALALGPGAMAWTVPAALLGIVSAVVVAIAAATDSPVVKADATNEGSFGPRLRSEAASEPPGNPNARSEAASEHPGNPNTRSEAASEHPRNPNTRSEAASEHPGNPNARSEPASEHPRNPNARSEPASEHPRNPNARSEPASEHPGNPNARSEPASEHPGNPNARLAPANEAPGNAIDPVSTLAAETGLLEQARTALREGHVDTALAALDAHLAEFPQGLLLDEARSTRLRALCAAGRSDEAAALAARLALGQPTSRWHDVVAASCG